MGIFSFLKIKEIRQFTEGVRKPFLIHLIRPDFEDTMRELVLWDHDDPLLISILLKFGKARVGQTVEHEVLLFSAFKLLQESETVSDHLV